jgi:leucyl-tRNA synthetase
MSSYNPQEIEKKWQQHWKDNNAYKVDNKSDKPKYYVLDMFPYPSGAGLHVGHPLGYIASDIVTRYKRHKGFNVLHPMGFDAFGLPAEQYAIQTGQHPAVTTAQNIKRYKEQLNNLGFSYDWDREVQTCDPDYYKWTQWIFCRLFESWYDKTEDKAKPISELIAEFEKEGNANINAHCDETESFSAGEWKAKSEEEQQKTLLNYRLAYLANSMVNWCPELGTVLANEEVKDGLSERGGYPVFKVNMRQWFLRITAYADRLLNDLDTIDWTDALKEQQRNWIGRSEGASINFKLDGHDDIIEVFSTRPDTIFGATFMVLAPEHELVAKITTADQKEEIEKYIEYAGKRSERDRMSEVKTITGCFTGAYAVNEFTGEKIPVWIADYVLAGYGTGAVMAVPAHDTRDYAFAKHFGLPIVQVVTDEKNTVSVDEEAYAENQSGVLVNSDFLNGMNVPEAKKAIISKLEELDTGKGKINYRLRDAGFSRQRYWGEPFPIVYRNGLPYLVDESELPVTLPEVESYKPTGDGNSPLAAIEDWVNTSNGQRETNTMPGWAGSSWYFLRYMDNKNADELVSNEAANYWGNVDLYLGGSEHATGHLLYIRFWTKFLNDIGKIPVNEPAKKLINQGMIQGTSAFVYRINGTNKFVSYNLKKDYETTPIHVDVNIVDGMELDIEQFKNWRGEYKGAEFVLEDGKYIVGNEVEKMSKSKWNIVSPDDMIEKYGADTLRLYEMFLGPLDQSKPWNTNGIEGVYRFLGKLWRLFFNANEEFEISEAEPTKEELKALHKAIKKTTEDIENFSFNTNVSAFMIAVNELWQLKCNKRAILEPLLICLSPYAPHIAEELWEKCGHGREGILDQPFPKHNEEYLVENTFNYPVSINGKMRVQIEFPLDAEQETIQEGVFANETVQKWMDGKPLKKFILVKGRIINVVV